VCSPLSARRADLVADRTRCQPHSSPAVSAAGKRVNSAPIRRRSLVEEGSTHVIVGRHGSYRAAWSGNWPGRSLGTKSALGGRAILQAVTRVKLEQASKVKLWMPTRLLTGEGCTNEEETDQAPVRSTGVLSTACRKSGLRKFGRPGAGGGRTSNITYKDGGRTGSRRGSRYRRCRAMPAEGRALTSDVLLKKERRGDWR
jgi:hypothetical protein